jgi:ankyrin repeat protein
MELFVCYKLSLGIICLSTQWTGQTMGNGIFNAAKEGNWDEVKSLTAAEQSFDYTAQHGSSGLLHLAAQQGNLDVVRWLVEEKNVPVDAYLNAETRENDPLMIASMHGHTEVVRFLVQHAPEDVYSRAVYINREDSNRRTALMHAAAGGHLEIVKILVEQGQANLETSKPYPFGFYSEEKAASWAKATATSALKIAEENGQDEVVQYLQGIVSTKGSK